MKKFLYVFSSAFFLTLLIISLFNFIPKAEAANGNWFVRPGGSGSKNGSDWNNAWDIGSINFSSVSCGDTIWLAGGTYTSGMNISKNCSASAVLKVNKVLSSDSAATAAAGWNSSFDSKVIIQNGGIELGFGSYYSINGRTGSPTANNFGIQITCTTSGGCDAMGEDSSGSSGTVDHVTLSYIEMYGPACVTSGSCGGGGASGLNLARNSTISNLLVDHNWIHRWGELIRTANWQNNTIQYSWLSDTHNDGMQHEDIMYNYAQKNLTMRYNKIWGSPNDGIFFDFGGTNGFYFYGNTYYHSGGQLITFKPGYTAATNVYYYNNVFENDGTFGDYQPGWLDFTGASGSSGEVANNVFENITINGTAPNANHNAFNGSVKDNGAGSLAYSISSQFANESSGNPPAADFHLTSTGISAFANKGKALSSSYNIDADGRVRGSDGAWDIGAYEASGAIIVPTPTPVATITPTPTPSHTPTPTPTPNPTFTSLPPVITGFSPTSGPGGTVVTIKGTGFTSTNNTIRFCSVSLSGISTNNAGSLVFTVPTTSGGGVCLVTVNNANGTSNIATFSTDVVAPTPIPPTPTPVHTPTPTSTPIPTPTSIPPSVCHIFNTNLAEGDDNSEVTFLQKVLNSNSATVIHPGGQTGTPGHEGTIYGPATAASVAIYQKLFVVGVDLSAEGLTTLQLSGVNGAYVGRKTRAILNRCHTVPSPTPTPTPTPVKTPTPTATPNPTGTPSPSSSVTLWTTTTIPSGVTANDSLSVELGLKFQSTVAGSVTGLRFYKGPQNTGIHTGHLWSSTGTLLASVTFTGETDSGWQTAKFSSPVAIQANTQYVISYFAPDGFYSYNANYFQTTFANGVLQVPAQGGIYHYGGSAFPSDTYNGNNYWVDVLFTSGNVVITPTPIPTATPIVTPTPVHTPTPTPTPTPIQTGKFSLGQSVTPITTVNTRATGAGTLLGTHAQGDVGTIIGGPVTAPLNGTSITWWNINFATGVDGWVGEDNLIASTGTPIPTPTPVHTPTPTAPQPTPTPVKTPTPTVIIPTPTPVITNTPVPTTVSSGGNWYVRPGGAGSHNGTDWNNAWDLGSIGWSSVQGGDNIWVAGGSYGSLNVGKGGSSSGSRIKILRALSSDSAATGAAGWSSSFDSLVNISGLINVGVNSNITIDGRTNYGIKVTTGSKGGDGVEMAYTGNVDSVTLSHIELLGPYCTLSNPCSSGAYAFNMAPYSFTKSNILISSVYIHGYSESFRANGWNNVVIEHSVIADEDNDGVDHEDVIYNYPSTNVTFRYNSIINSPADGIFFEYGGATNWNFYGNLYYNSRNHMIFTKAPGTYGPIHIYNNVFAAPSASQYGFISNNGSTMAAGTEVANNIFVNVSNDMGGNDHNNAYNYTTLNGYAWPSNEPGAFTFTGSPFVNAAAGDYHLNAAGIALFKNKGSSLGVVGTSNVDADGHVRGADGSWDIGAYEN